MVVFESVSIVLEVRIQILWKKQKIFSKNKKNEE